GAVPADAASAGYKDIVAAVREVCDYCKRNGQRFHLETGQETVDVLLRFIKDVGRDNLGINFDPANMILYNNGDPVAALRLIGRRVRGVHLKDALKTKVPGTWGAEVTVGTGEVNWPAFLAALAAVGFPGWLCLEREAGTQRVEDIRTGRLFVEKLLRGA
ncbi:MAG: sugar phosphate isomerase/epimerase, partial [Planctomycetota bacterium]|nr:sugar phosphate isomerase/epimerase [Planctomycetota bacterium]